MKTTLTKLDVTLLIARITISVVMFAHGAQKLLGWFGGYGFDNTMNFFTDSIGLPWLFGFAIIICESFGMIFLLLGIWTRLLTTSVIIIMIGAIMTVHVPFGFFMDWDGVLQGEGFELHILMIGLSLIGTLYGGGKISVQYWLPRRFRRKHMNDGMYFI